jgi:hypothetical protein
MGCAAAQTCRQTQHGQSSVLDVLAYIPHYRSAKLSEVQADAATAKTLTSCLSLSLSAGAGIMALIQQFTMLAVPLLVQRLLLWYENPATPVAEGYVLAVVS